ncbi:MAG: hypothetical protein ACRDQ5_07370, partial [Sciscionella sp.]
VGVGVGVVGVIFCWVIVVYVGMVTWVIRSDILVVFWHLRPPSLLPSSPGDHPKMSSYGAESFYINPK